MQKSETKEPNAANSIPDSFQAFGLEEPQRGMSTLSEQHRVFTQQRSVRAKNDQEIWNSDLIKYERYTGAPWGEDSQAEVRMPEERHRPMIGYLRIQETGHPRNEFD